MIRSVPRSVEEMFEAGKPIDDALQRAVRDALVRHKRLGQEIVVWQDGRIVCLRASQIPDPANSAATDQET